MKEAQMDIHCFSRAELIGFCRAVANVVASDRKISDEERGLLAELIQETGLSMADEDVQRAVYSELSHPAPMAEIAKVVTSPALRKNLYRTLIEVALADGLAPEEEAKLAEVAKQFGLDCKAAREMVHWTLSSIELEKREHEIMKRL
jgi:uncharacterized membrane protein YebE (DUF533 family)